MIRNFFCAVLINKRNILVQLMWCKINKYTRSRFWCSVTPSRISLAKELNFFIKTLKTGFKYRNPLLFDSSLKMCISKGKEADLRLLVGFTKKLYYIRRNKKNLTRSFIVRYALQDMTQFSSFLVFCTSLDLRLEMEKVQYGIQSRTGPYRISRFKWSINLA